jgi:hypothetical protein
MQRRIVMRTISRTLSALTAATVAAAGLAVALPATAHAKTKSTIDLRGYSVPAAPVDGVVSFTGLTTGDPFHGDTFTGSFGAVDGTLPTAQQCEPASGSMTIGNAGNGYITLALSGEICDHWGTYRTFGDWKITDGSGQYAKAKGNGMFSFSAQSWGTLWSASGQMKA